MYNVPSQPGAVQRMTTRRWIAWVIVCLLASFFAFALVYGGLRQLLPAQPRELRILDFVVLVLSLHSALWLAFLRRLGVPPRWILWASPGGLVTGVLALFVAPPRVPAPYGALILLAVFVLGVFVVQWLTLRRHLPQAAALVLVEVGLYVLLYGSIAWAFLRALQRFQ